MMGVWDEGGGHPDEAGGQRKNSEKCHEQLPATPTTAEMKRVFKKHTRCRSWRKDGQTPCLFRWKTQRKLQRSCRNQPASTRPQHAEGHGREGSDSNTLATNAWKSKGKEHRRRRM